MKTISNVFSGPPEQLRLWQLGLFILAFFLYGNTLFNSYNLDDELVTTEQNQLVQEGINALPEIFTTHYFIWNNYKADYRPLVKTSFALEHQLFGFNPFVSHLINVFLFTIIVVLTLAFLCSVFPSANIHVLGAIVLLFAAHPINTEVVASLKNRDELFSFLFVLLSFRSVFKWLSQGKRAALALAVLFFLLSLLSKMSSVTWLSVLVAVMIFNKPSRQRGLVAIGALVGLTAIFYAAVFGLLEGWGREFVFIEVPFFEIDSVAEKWASIISVAGYYLKLLVYPYPLCCYYGYNQIPVTNWSDWTVYVSIMSYMGLLWAAISGLRKPNLIGFGAIIILCDLVLFLNVLYPYTGVIGERVLFGSTLGVALIFVGLLDKYASVLGKTFGQFVRLSKGFVLSVLLVGLVAAWFTVNRNVEWKNRLTLFSADSENCQNSVKLQQLYAHQLRQDYLDNPSIFSEEKAQEALSVYERSIGIYDQWPVTHYGAGNIWFFDLNKPEKALPYYKKAVSLNPDYVDANYDLLNAYLAVQDFENAEKVLNDLAQKFPEDETLFDRVLNELFKENRLEQAEAINQRFLKEFPNFETPLIYQGNFVLSRGDTLKALSVYEKALDINPSYIELDDYVNRLYLQIAVKRNDKQ
jgi:tetratricopeptide (TPR) repeat protein